MLTLKSRLLASEDDFLLALDKGGHALTSFNERWEQLLAEVDLALDTDTLDSDTAQLAHTVTQRLVTLADASAEIFASCDSLTVQLMDQIDTLMCNLTISSPCSSSPTPSSRQSQSHQAAPTLPINPKKRRREGESCDQLPTKRSKLPHPVLVDTHNSVYSLADSVGSQTFESNATKLNSKSSKVSLKRKRCSSDADIACPVPQRTKYHHLGPRLHAVSDSYVRPWLESICAAEVKPLPPFNVVELEPIHSTMANSLLELPDCSEALASSPLASAPLCTSELDAFLAAMLGPPTDHVELSAPVNSGVLHFNTASSMGEPSMAQYDALAPVDPVPAASFSTIPVVEHATPPPDYEPLFESILALPAAPTPSSPASMTFSYLWEGPPVNPKAVTPIWDSVFTDFLDTTSWSSSPPPPYPCSYPSSECTSDSDDDLLFTPKQIDSLSKTCSKPKSEHCPSYLSPLTSDVALET